MSNLSFSLCGAAVLLAFSGSLAGAAVIEFATAGANVQIDGDGTATIASPVATKTSTQTFTGPGGFSDVATGSATQNENGFSEVEAKVSHVGIDGLAANGTLTPHRVDSNASRSIVYTNTSTTTAYLGVFDFTISGGYLETQHYSGGTTVSEASIGFYAGQVGGESFDADMTLTGAPNSHTITRANGFAGSVTLFDCFGTFCGGGFVNVDTLTGSLNLGVLAPGQSTTVITLLHADNNWAGIEIGAQARVRDPNGLNSFGATFTAVTAPPAVPLPAGGVLLISALGIGGILRLRARRAA